MLSNGTVITYYAGPGPLVGECFSPLSPYIVKHEFES